MCNQARASCGLLGGESANCKTISLRCAPASRAHARGHSGIGPLWSNRTMGALRDIACAGEHRRNSLCVTWRKVRRLGTPTKGPCRTAWRAPLPSCAPQRPRGWRRTSLHRLAAIDHQGVPDDEGGRLRTQPDDGRGNLLGPAHPPDRLPRDHPLASLGGAPAEAVHHRGFDDPGAHGVDAEVQRRVVEGRRLGKADDAEFRGAVRGLTGDAFDPGARRRCSRSPHPLA